MKEKAEKTIQKHKRWLQNDPRTTAAIENTKEI